MTAITDALRITRSVRLDQVDPRSTPGFEGDKVAGAKALAAAADHLSQLQERLFAASKAGGERSVLLVVQGMDTAGKGGIMRHVLGQVDPQGVKITSFKAPTDAEKRHDFLWRFEPALPKAGQIAVFDRSHYEDVLIHRVRGFSEPDVIQERYGQIVEFERGLTERGITVLKVMLHVSFEEQGARLLERLDRPDKHWKYNPNDVEERTRFPDYMEAYQIAINRTARAAAPWHVVPADRKWYARLAVQELLVEALEAIDPQWPEAEFDVAVERAKLIALGGVPPTEEAKAEAKAKAKDKEKQAKKDKKKAKAAKES